MLLEVHFEKQDLLNAYINEIYLGQDGRRAIHGFGLASQFYFGKPLAELQLHEVALLVAIVRGPSYYDPRRHPERVASAARSGAEADGRLRRHRREGRETGAWRDRWASSASARRRAVYYPAFLDLVRRTLRRDYRDEDLTEAGLKIFSTLNPLVQSRAETALKQELERLDKARKKKQAQPLEGVVVVTAPQNGEVIAMVGGRQASFDGFNRALDAKRSIGSLVKPVIYLAAVETGHFNAASIIEDGPVEVKLANGKTVEAAEYLGGVLRTGAAGACAGAIDESRHGAPRAWTSACRRSRAKFKALGLENEPPQLPSVLLGSLDVSPLEVAQLYNAFANGGFNTPLRAVRAVVDAEGKPLKSFALEVTPVATPQAVYQVNRMLVQVMERGTGARGARAPAVGPGRRRQERHVLGLSRQLVRGILRQSSRRGVDRLRRQHADRTDRLVRIARGVVAPDGFDQHHAVELPLPEGLEETWIEYRTGYGGEARLRRRADHRRGAARSAAADEARLRSRSARRSRATAHRNGGGVLFGSAAEPRWLRDQS